MSVFSFTRSMICLVLALGVSSTKSEVIYDNSGPGDASLAWWSLFEYGDEITLGGTNRVLTQFQFEYYGDFKASGDETARVRIYKNDGPLIAPDTAAPGTLLFDSGSFRILPDWQTWTSGALSIPLPDYLTWTVQFSGVAGSQGDRSGIIFRNPPSVGSSFNDAWMRTADGWQSFQWGADGPIANFAARLISDPTRVSILRKPTTVLIEWIGPSILQEATTAAGPYTDIPNARNRYELPVRFGSPMKFWRLRD